MRLFNIFREVLVEQVVKTIDEDQMTAYHGSPHLFDKFTTEKMGTGEGVQAFGWGLYFTDLDDIAKNYAEKLRINKSYFLDEEVPNYYLQNTLPNKVKELAEEVIREMPNGAYKNPELPFINSAVDLAKTIQKKNVFAMGITFRTDDIKLDNIIDESNETYEKYGYHTALGMEALLAKKLIENGFKTISLKTNLYKVTLHKGKTPDQYIWLDWDLPVPDSIYETIGYKLKYNDKFLKELFQDSQEFVKYDGTIIKGDRPDGFLFYKKISNILGSDKKASLFLLKNGIDGIRFPSNGIAGGKTRDNTRGFNYVVFDENAIDVEEKTQFE